MGIKASLRCQVRGRIDAGRVTHSPILLGKTLLTKAAWRPSSPLGKVMQGTLGEGLISPFALVS